MAKQSAVQGWRSPHGRAVGLRWLLLPVLAVAVIALWWAAEWREPENLQDRALRFRQAELLELGETSTWSLRHVQEQAELHPDDPVWRATWHRARDRHLPLQGIASEGVEWAAGALRSERSLVKRVAIEDLDQRTSTIRGALYQRVEFVSLENGELVR